VPALTVLKKPLALFSQKPMTGFYRDGYCRVGPEDRGNHAIAGTAPFCPPHSPPSPFQSNNPIPWPSLTPQKGVLTKEFLDFSTSRGNNLRSIGLEPGCKWCLCTARWKEAMDSAKSQNDPVVPKVFLHATDESALEHGITMEALKKFAAEAENKGRGGSLEKHVASIEPQAKGGIATETH